MEASESVSPESAPSIPDTKTDSVPAEPVVAPEVAQPAPDPAPPVQPVRVDNKSRRSDDDALEGHFALVVDGDHKGQIGSFVNVAEYDEESGYPSRVLLRFRDANYDHEYAVVDYASVRPADPYRGGR